MSYTSQTTIWCDGEGCGQWEQIGTGSVAKARAVLKKEGWSRRRSDDLCPTCTKKLKEEVRNGRGEERGTGGPV